ncbi:hypothetical protein [uncultured Roseibium sp.]|uniref:hypothetical protein n=1 Tax=uncultured Roseibium sp. TaxID=1936171 RepID=UPI0032177AC9
MTDTTMGQPKPPLGVGEIISDSFSILFGKFIPVIIVAFVPSLIGLLLSGMLVGFGAVLGTETPQYTGPGMAVANVLSGIIDIVVYSISAALLVQLAYDAKLGRPVQLGRYFGPTLSALFPLVVLSLVAGILAGLATIVFIIPGLWVYAVFSVMVPAIVIDRVGFGGLGRSAFLTKEYRWPIVGAMILIVICAVLITFAAAFIIGLIVNILPFGMILGIPLFAALSAIGAGILGIFVALLYARLREIKEGVSVDQIASVFD